MKLIKTVSLVQYSEDPIRAWEEAVCQLHQEAKANRKIVKKTRKGFLVTHPVGTQEKCQFSELSGWIRDQIPNTLTDKMAIPSPFGGEATVEPHEWVEQYVDEPYVEIPPKPDPIQGFNWLRKSEVARLINELIGTSWTHFDVPTAKNGAYTVKRNGEILSESESFKLGDPDIGYADWVKVTYNVYFLKIFPDRYEVWLDTEEDLVKISGGSYNGNPSTSIEADGFWNK